MKLEKKQNKDYTRFKMVREHTYFLDTCCKTMFKLLEDNWLEIFFDSSSKKYMIRIKSTDVGLRTRPIIEYCLNCGKKVEIEGELGTIYYGNIVK